MAEKVCVNPTPQESCAVHAPARPYVRVVSAPQRRGRSLPTTATFTSACRARANRSSHTSSQSQSVTRLYLHRWQGRAGDPGDGGHDLQDWLLGQDTTEVEALNDAMQWRLHYVGRGGIASFAISAVDIALWDLRGRREGKPLWRMAGGGRQP